MKYYATIAAIIASASLFSSTNFKVNSVSIAKQVDYSLTNTVTSIEILDPEALKFLDPSTPVETIASGFIWSEGPLYIADGDYLIFSDVPRNKIYQWKRGGDTSTYLTPSGLTENTRPQREPGSNGLLLSQNGQLIVTQQGNRRLALMDAPLSNPQAKFKVLTDHYSGKRFNSPNDAVLAPNGDIYFTDPPYGLDKGVDDPAKQLSFQGVFCLRPDGQVVLITDELKYPNGITLSPDGHFLYVDNSGGDNKIWMKYELNEKGLIKNKSVFYKATEAEAKTDGSPDGMKMSRNGYLFTSAPGGLWIFNPAGKVIAKIHTDRPASNCAFGKDQKELFITDKDLVLRVALK